MNKLLIFMFLFLFSPNFQIYSMEREPSTLQNALTTLQEIIENKDDEAFLEFIPNEQNIFSCMHYLACMFLGGKSVDLLMEKIAGFIDIAIDEERIEFLKRMLEKIKPIGSLTVAKIIDKNKLELFQKVVEFKKITTKELYEKLLELCLPYTQGSSEVMDWLLQYGRKNKFLTDEVCLRLCKFLISSKNIPMFIKLSSYTEAGEAFIEKYIVELLEEFIKIDCYEIVKLMLKAYLKKGKLRDNDFKLLNNIQELFQKYLMQKAQNASEEKKTVAEKAEKFMHLFLTNGANLSNFNYVDLCFKFMKENIATTEQRTWDLATIFMQSGITQFRENSEEFIKKALANPELTIADSSTKKNITLLFGKLAENIGRYLTERFSKRDGKQVDLTYALPVNKRNSYNQSMLIWTAIFNNFECAKELILNHNAHVNARDNKKRTAIFYAVRYADPKFVSLLINYGAYLWIRDEAGMTPLQHAIERGNHSIIILLIAAMKNKDNALEDEAKTNFFSEENNINALQDVSTNESFGLAKIFI